LYETVHVEYALGLDKIRACCDFLGKPDRAPVCGVCEGIRCRADEQLRRNLDPFTAYYFPLIPHIPDRLQELDGIEIKDPYSLFLVPEAVVVSGKAQNIPDPEGIGAEKVALEGNPVPVPSHHLEDRFMAESLQNSASGYRRHSDYGSLIVGNIDRVNAIEKIFSFFFEHCYVGAFRRAAFGGDGKMSRAKDFFETAFGLHGF
jgi:hypothetical protein